MIRAVELENPFYNFFRSSTREILEVTGVARRNKNVAYELLALNDALMIVREFAVTDLSVI